MIIPASEDTAAIWLRVSTDQQDVENQRAALLRLARDRDLRLDPRWGYEMKGVSAWKGDHSVFLDDALADARAKRFRYLLIWALDRLSRQGSEDSLRIVREFEEAGVTVISLQEPWLESSGDDREVMIAITGHSSRSESKRRSDRVKASNDRRRAEGKVIGSSPYEYMMDPKTGFRIVDEPHAQIVRLIFDLYDSKRQGVRMIQKTLNNRYRSPNGKVIWGPETIRRILRREIYTGGTDKFGIETPRIVADDLFRRVQARLGANNYRKPSTKRVLPLQGRLRCSCGGNWHYDAASSGTGNDYYRCRNTYSHTYHVMRGGDRCTIPPQPAKVLHDSLRSSLSTVLKDPEDLMLVLDAHIKTRETEMAAGPGRVDKLEDEKRNLLEELRQIERSRIKGRLPKSELDEMESKAEQRLADVDYELDNLNSEQDQKLKRARSLLQGAIDLRQVAMNRKQYSDEYPSHPVPFGVFSCAPQFAESDELIEFRASGEWPGKFSGDVDPDIQLERILDDLHAEVVMNPTVVEIRGLINIEVAIIKAQSGSLHASQDGRGLR